VGERAGGGERSGRGEGRCERGGGRSRGVEGRCGRVEGRASKRRGGGRGRGKGRASKRGVGSVGARGEMNGRIEVRVREGRCLRGAKAQWGIGCRRMRRGAILGREVHRGRSWDR